MAHGVRVEIDLLAAKPVDAGGGMCAQVRRRAYGAVVIRVGIGKYSG